MEEVLSPAKLARRQRNIRRRKDYEKLIEKKKRDGTYEQWRQECQEKQKFYYRRNFGKQVDSVPNDVNKKKRQEIYKQRIERLKRDGKYEEYLAKRRKQARKLYHTVDENGNKPYREKENKRYRERILRLKETGAYRDHLDKCNERTKL